MYENVVKLPRPCKEGGELEHIMALCYECRNVIDVPWLPGLAYLHALIITAYFIVFFFSFFETVMLPGNSECTFPM